MMHLNFAICDTGVSSCSVNNGGCVSLCFEEPSGGNSCGCADIYLTSAAGCLCVDNKPVPRDGNCPAGNRTGDYTFVFLNIL